MPELTARALLLVALGGSLGALVRYGAGLAFTRDYPWGTVAVNLAGSFLIGAFVFGGLARGGLSPEARLFFGIGFLGALTTMSSFALEFVDLIDRGHLLRAAAFFLLNPVLAIGGVLAGRAFAFAALPG